MTTPLTDHRGEKDTVTNCTEKFAITQMLIMSLRYYEVVTKKGRAIFDRNKGKPTLFSERWDKDILNCHQRCTNCWPTLIQVFMELVVKLEVVSHS